MEQESLMERNPSTISMLTPVLSSVSLQNKNTVNKPVFPHTSGIPCFTLNCMFSVQNPFLSSLPKLTTSHLFLNAQCDYVAVNAIQSKKVKILLLILFGINN